MYQQLGLTSAQTRIIALGNELGHRIKQSISKHRMAQNQKNVVIISHNIYKIYRVKRNPKANS